MNNTHGHGMFGMEDIAFSVANAALDGMNDNHHISDNSKHPFNPPPPLYQSHHGYRHYEPSYGGAQVDYGSLAFSNDTSHVKLFIGQIPMNYGEAMLLPVFSPYGNILELVVLKDKVSGCSRGCGFVVYESSAAAERAMSALNNRVSLGGTDRMLIVRRAVNNHRRQASPDKTVYKLFVGMLSKVSDERRVRDIFEAFGPVHEVYLMRNAVGASKGCAFVKFTELNHALNAIAYLHESFVDQGAPRPLNVRFANREGQPPTPSGDAQARSSPSPPHPRSSSTPHDSRSGTPSGFAMSDSSPMSHTFYDGAPTPPTNQTAFSAPHVSPVALATAESPSSATMDSNFKLSSFLSNNNSNRHHDYRQGDVAKNFMQQH